MTYFEVIDLFIDLRQMQIDDKKKNILQNNEEGRIYVPAGDDWF